MKKQIILIRHAKVDLEAKNSISAFEFTKWVQDYNNSDIESPNKIDKNIINLFDESNLIFVSKLKRTLQTAKLFTEKNLISDSIFNEAEMPSNSLKFIKMSSNFWLIFFRLAWIFGYSKETESFKKFKLRIKLATQKLIQASEIEENIILVGHGISNRFILKELIKNNWKLELKSGNKNLGFFVVEK